MNLTKESFEEWKTHPVTKEVFLDIEKAQKDLLENLSNGVTLGQQADITHGLTNRMIGQIEGLRQLRDIFIYEEAPIEEVNPISGY